MSDQKPLPCPTCLASGWEHSPEQLNHCQNVALKIKPCPFCGADAYMSVLGGKGSAHRVIQCSSKNCKCDMSWYPTEESAVAAWNARPLTPQQEAAKEPQTVNEELVEALEGTERYFAAKEKFIGNPATRLLKQVRAALARAKGLEGKL